MKRIIYITLAALLLAVGASATAQAQAKQYYSLNWNIALPMGEFGDFINNVSLRGGNFNVQVFLNDNVAVGGTFGWNHYYELKDRASYLLAPGMAITAADYRYAYTMPVTANGYYHFMPDGMVQPYAGVGIGALYGSQHNVIQEADSWDEQWGFLVTPEVGVFVPFGKDVPFGAKASVAYMFTTNKFLSLGETYNSIQNLNFNIGFAWMIK